MLLVRRDLQWAYASPSGGLYAWSRDYVRSLAGVSLDSRQYKHVILFRLDVFDHFEFYNGSGLWR